MFLAGIGTDTAGSIRIPAAFCGISGLMPTYGRVPKSGCVPLGYSLDHIGPLARSARDCGAMLGVIAGFDPSDPTCVDRPVPDFVAGLDGRLDGLRVGVERTNHFPDAADPALAGCFDAAVDALTGLGAEVVEVTLPHYAEVGTAVVVTMAAEALAYHRNDIKARGQDYFAGTRQVLAMGALASGADYVQAQRVRRLVQGELAELFRTVDVVASPAAAIGSPSYELLDREGIMGVFRLIFTAYWDGVGNPVLVVPMGFTEAGLPLSLQLAGRPFEEGLLVRAGRRLPVRHRLAPPGRAGRDRAARRSLIPREHHGRHRHRRHRRRVAGGRRLPPDTGGARPPDRHLPAAPAQHRRLVRHRRGALRGARHHLRRRSRLRRLVVVTPAVACGHALRH